MGQRLFSSERGAVFVWFALSFVLLIGFIGVGVDIGRMYVVRTETQGFVDPGALAAAAQLDGTAAGLTRARNQATVAWNKYHFHSTNFAAPTVEFALAAPDGSTPPYQASWTTTPPSPPLYYQFVRVTSAVAIPMTLMSIVTSSSNATVSARAIAGQLKVTAANEGIMPFAVVVHATDAATYGLVPGQNYNIRWTNTNKLSEYCQGDQIDAPGSPIPSYTTANPDYAGLGKSSVYNGHQFLYDAENAGFGSKGTETGCGSGGCNWTSFIIQDASQIAAAVEAGYQGAPISIGTDMKTWLDGGGGGSINTIGGDLNTRVGRDSNQTSYYTACATISDCATNVVNFETGYNGNGQRIAALPMIGPPTYGNTADQITTVVNFGAFLLDIAAAYKTTGNASWCAMYLGSVVEGTNHPGAGGPGLYALRLVQ